MNQRLRRLFTGITVMSLFCAGTFGLCPDSAVQQTTPAQAAGGLLAFPGATGAGRYATGGRGGEIYHVTNLNDSGAGSLRDAVSKPNRIVVFDVSGTIELSGNIVCTDNITIAGQTAPGGSGVTLKNYKFGMGGDNIIVRYLSSRPGPDKCTSSGNDGWGGAKGSNSIVDHCSLGWTTDEQWGLYSNNEYYTVQYSVIGPANSWGGHVKGVHGFGIMMGKGYFSFDHNLIIHNVSRNFRGKTQGTETADFTNNIIYDWGYQTAYGTIGHLNYVNNTLKAGNSTTGGYHWMYVDSGTSPQNFKVYCAGNRLINKDGSFHAITNDNWSGVTVKEAIGITKNDLYSASPFGTTVNGENVSTAATCESAEASYEHVIEFAGNGISPDKRTAIDRQCAEETKNGTGQCSGTEAFDSSVSELTKYSIQCGVTYQYPSAVTKKEITDADNDGMDDAWELARGLNPNDGTDYKGDYCGMGYMNIEYYINDLTVNSVPAGVVELSPENGIDPISAFETIEGESYAAQEGVRAEDNASCSGGQNVGFVENGDYVMFRKVDFDGTARSFTANVSGNAAGIEIYLDALSGTPAAKLNFSGTSGFSDYQQITWGIQPIDGQHNVYLKFTGGEGYLLNLDSFVFGHDAIPINGKFFRNLEVEGDAHPEGWVIAENAAVGSAVFGDRDFTFTQLPDSLVGAEQILTACDAKNCFTDYATFTAASDCTLTLAVDQRVDTAGNLADWIAGFTRLSDTALTSNDVTMLLFTKNLQAGETVTLGTNNMSGSCVNYTVFLSGTPAAETTTTTTTTTTETTTVPPVTAAVRGDVDCNGDVNVADAVLLARFLAEDKEITVSAQGKVNANVSGDADTTSDDLGMILEFLAGLTPEL